MQKNSNVHQNMNIFKAYSDLFRDNNKKKRCVGCIQSLTNVLSLMDKCQE